MIKRWIAFFAASASLLFAPSPSHAQVADTILKCTQSWKIAIVCVVIERGVEKVVEVGLDQLVALASGSTKELPTPYIGPSQVKLADVKANGIEWSKLKEFLLSVFPSATPVDDVQAREKVAASCSANYMPVCRYLGIPEPRQQMIDCSKILTKQECAERLTCSWTNSSCAKGFGTRELFNR